MSPHNVVLQPVIQFGTAIDGERFSSSAVNRFQKLMHVENLPPSSAEMFVVPFGF
jgi:hypothetical protein